MSMFWRNIEQARHMELASDVRDRVLDILVVRYCESTKDAVEMQGRSATRDELLGMSVASMCM